MSGEIAYGTKNSVWPKNVSEGITEVVKEFFALLDIRTDDGAKAWADLFMPDGEFVCGSLTSKGHEELLNYLYTLWASFQVSQHRLKKVYTHQPNGLDLICIMNINYTLKDGTKRSRDTISNFLLTEGNGSRLAVERVELFMDPAELVADLALR